MKTSRRHIRPTKPDTRSLDILRMHTIKVNGRLMSVRSKALVSDTIESGNPVATTMTRTGMTAAPSVIDVLKIAKVVPKANNK
jgi:hypothetical protein